MWLNLEYSVFFANGSRPSTFDEYEEMGPTVCGWLSHINYRNLTLSC